MTTTDLASTLERMRRYGGNFCTHLANTTAAADPGNRQRLLNAFPEVFQKYGPNGPFANTNSTPTSDRELSHATR